jgi:SAM-dependent methyltransferase
MAHFFPEVPGGACQNGVRCENLEALTFPAEQFDLVVTQDVLEHVLSPEKGFREIERVLKPGGAHIFTVPYNRCGKTIVRAVEAPGGRKDFKEPQYHGNPVDPAGSLVTVDWGYDLPEYVYAESGMVTTIFCLADKQLLPGVEPLEVFVSRKADVRSADDGEEPAGIRQHGADQWSD